MIVLRKSKMRSCILLTSVLRSASLHAKTRHAFSNLRFQHPEVGSSILQHQTTKQRYHTSQHILERHLSAADVNDEKRERFAELAYRKSIRREDRLSLLRDKPYLSSAEQKEFDGLQGKSGEFEEQYNPLNFSEQHREFKKKHNQAFVALCTYCSRRCPNDDAEEFKIFFLDGQDAGTSSALLAAGFSTSQMFVANRHQSSCQSLIDWGLPASNVAHESAHVALSTTSDRESVDGGGGIGKFGDKYFGAYYFDGCGGYAPLIVEMLVAAFATRANRDLPIAVGISVLGGNRDIVDKEQGIIQQLVVLAKQTSMRVVHVLDDPVHYGIDPSLSKIDGSTMTSWFMLEPIAQ